MGKVGKFIGGVGAVVVGTLTGQGWLTAIGINAVLGTVASTLEPGEQQRALEVNSADTQAPLSVVYGTAKLGLRLVDIRVGGSDNKFLYIVGALCHGSSDGTGIEAIDEIYFNDRKAFSASAGATLATPESWLDGKAVVNKRIGTDAQTNDSLIHEDFPTEWPSTSKGRGIAYLAFRLEYDAEVFSTGIPNITAIVRGCKVPDPANLGNDSAHSTNPARCLYDYLTSNRYGIQVPASDIDATSFAAMASYCDELVSVPDGSQKRFECNGVIDVSQGAQANIAQLLSSCRGNLVYQNGKYRLFIRRAVTPTSFALTEANTVGGLGIRTLGVAGCPNQMRVTHVEPGAEATVDGIIYGPTYAAETRYYPRPGETNDFLTEDNDFEVVQDLQLPCTHSPLTAEQIAMVTLREQRGATPAGAVGVRLFAHESALQLQVGDVVPLSRDTPNWDAKPFWVMGIGSVERGLVELSLLEYVADAYALDVQGNFDPRPTMDPPNLYVVDPPTSLVLTSDGTTVIRTVEGNYQPAINVAWSLSPDPYVDYYEIEAKRSADSAWLPFVQPIRTATQAMVVPVTPYESWDVRLRAANTQGKTSPWVEDTVVTGALAPLIHPIGRGGIVNGNGEQGVVGLTVPGWTATQGDPLVVATDEVRIGTRSMKIAHDPAPAGSLDTRDKRASAISLSLPWRGLLPTPNGAVSAADRAQTATMYRGLAAGANSASGQDVELRSGRIYRISGLLKHGGTTGPGAGVALVLTPDDGQTLTVLERQGTALGSASDPDVGIPAGSAVDWTFVQFLVTPDIDGTGQLANAFGYDGVLTGSAWFSDVKFEEVPVDTVLGGKRGFDTIDSSGGVHVPDDQGVNVGTQAAGSTRTKPVRYSFAMLQATDPTQLTPASYDSYVPYHEAAYPNSAVLVGNFFFPQGVELTNFKTAMDSSTGLNLANVKLYRDGTAIATINHGSGDTVLSSALSQVVGGENYSVVVQMGPATTSQYVRFKYFEIEYEMSHYEHAY